MNEAQARAINEELRGVRESLDRVGATVEDARRARAGGQVPPAVRTKANDILLLLKGSTFYVPVADMLNDLLHLVATRD